MKSRLAITSTPIAVITSRSLARMSEENSPESTPEAVLEDTAFLKHHRTCSYLNPHRAANDVCCRALLCGCPI
jgi:hypothetical protein